VGEISEIQGNCVDAVHSHSGCAVIVTAATPPVASSVGGVLTATWHLTGVGPAVDVEDEEHDAAISAAMSNAITA
jgi:hypothetical protein